MIGNCDVWAYVDFGEGSVRVRCTETGVHAEHKVLIYIPEADRKPREDVKHGSNIFERQGKRD